MSKIEYRTVLVVNDGPCRSSCHGDRLKIARNKAVWLSTIRIVNFL
jgi:hypothetical protein